MVFKILEFFYEQKKIMKNYNKLVLVILILNNFVVKLF